MWPLLFFLKYYVFYKNRNTCGLQLTGHLVQVDKTESPTLGQQVRPSCHMLRPVDQNVQPGTQFSWVRTRCGKHEPQNPRKRTAMGIGFIVVKRSVEY